MRPANPPAVDSTFVTILILLALATLVALIQARRRDRCLRSFEGFPVTLERAGGNLAWGTLDLYATGIELRYGDPVEADLGHVERSLLLYREEYPSVTALYRFPDALRGEREDERVAALQATARPGLLRRLRRRLRNAVALLRDALVQSAGLIVGAIGASRPGLAKNQAGIQQLSTEALGSASGAAYDPLLEAHLFRMVTVDLIAEDKPVRTFCGWLKDYTTQFVELVDAFGNDAQTVTALTDVRPDAAPGGVDIAYADGRVRVTNLGERLLYLDRVWAEGEPLEAPADSYAPPGASAAAPASAPSEAWSRAFDCVLPPGSHADVPAPPTEFSSVRVRMGPAGRVDLVLPRALARVRHASDGSEAVRAERTPEGAEREQGRMWKL